MKINKNMYAIKHHSRLRSNTDPVPKPTKPKILYAHSTTSSTDSGYSSGEISFCSQDPCYSRRNSTCEGHPVIFECGNGNGNGHGDEVEILYIGEAQMAHLSVGRGKSRMISLGHTVGKEKKKEEGIGKSSSIACQKVIRNSYMFQPTKPVRRGKMMKDKMGKMGPVYCDEEPIDLGRRIVRESLGLMPAHNLTEGGGEHHHSMRHLWTWRFGHG